MEKILISNSLGLGLSTVIHRPEGEVTKKFPAVIALHGFFSWKDDVHMIQLCNDLAKNGMVGVRFDACGYGESEGATEEYFRFSQFLNDLKSVIDYVSQLDYVDPEKLGLFGHSIGSMVGLIAAADNKNIKAIASLGTMSKVTEINFSQPIDMWRRSGWFEKERPGFGTIRVPYAFVEDMSAYNLYDYLGKVKQRKLFIIARHDVRVPREVNEAVINAAPEPKQHLKMDINHDYRNFPDQIVKVNSVLINFFKEAL